VACAPAFAATVKLKASNGQYIAVDSAGNTSLSSTAATFTLVDGQCLLEGDPIGLRAPNGKFLTVAANGVLKANASSQGTNEKFTIRRYSDTSNNPINDNTAVKLVAANNNFICSQSNNTVLANCGSAIDSTRFTLSLSPALTNLTATASMGKSPTKAGTTHYLRVTPNGGPSGTTKYRYVVEKTDGTDVLDTGEIDAYSYTWSNAPAGSYKLTGYVYRYCQGTRVAQASAVSPQQDIIGMTFTAPTAGQSLTAGTATTIRWTPENYSGNIKLEYYEGGTRKGDIATSVPASSGSYSWTPTTNATNASIVIRHATNIGLNWTGPTFSVTGGGSGGGGTPTVSFANHLYPLITNPQKCAMCHPAGGINPQAARPDDSSTTCNDSVGIPFSTSITASTMLARFKCMKARSTQGEYQQALGKVYVVPYQSAQSGLHHKAQASNAPTFSENLTINGVTKKVKEWITIWIDQGANP
jgi:hypothetical protein